MGFKDTIHDKTILYFQKQENKIVYLLRQLDDFAFVCEDEQIAKNMFNVLGQLLKLPSEEKVPFKYMGPVDDFNGVDIIQLKQYIGISCQKYIEGVLKSHG